MDKSWFKSKTFYGTILLAVEAGLKSLPVEWTYAQAALTSVGFFLTVFGFRDAMGSKTIVEVPVVKVGV